MINTRATVRLVAMVLACAACAQAQLATTQQVLESRVDLWGEAALKQPGGPTLEFFKDLLPPMRYVDARFRYYPIAVSAPGAPIKARLVSNGSQINALANQPNWRNEVGLPVHIKVGREGVTFGEHLGQLEGPTYEQGYLPIVNLKYRHRDQVYQQEVFASCDPELIKFGVVLARFTLVEGSKGKVEAQIEAGYDYYWASRDEETPEHAAAGTVAATQPAPARAKDEREPGTVRGPVKTDPAAAFPGKEFAEKGPTAPMVAAYDGKWVWNKYRNTLMAYLSQGQSATIAVFTKPAEGASPIGKQIDESVWNQQKELATKTWNDVLARGMNVEVPEPYVNHAWRSSVIGNFVCLSGDAMRYSAGNQYARLYIGEGGDTVRAMALYGQLDDAKRMMVPLFKFTRKGLEFHQAAFKLQMLAHLYALTRDKQWVRDHRDLWEKEIQVILQGREKSTGMLPREKYCGDIETRVYSLNSNSNCWRALRDMTVVLADVGETARSQELTPIAAEYRQVILDAIDKAKRRDVNPPFLPVALSGEEEPHDPIADTRIGSYWNLMINYILGSGVFRYDSQTANEVVEYLQKRGGLCMGMTRSQRGGSFWVGTGKMNDLYGMRYVLLMLQRDEPDRALVSFYGKLAHGFTRDTFIDGEGHSIGEVDGWGRQFYLPPNSAGNAGFMQQLRYVLVQDWDLDDDGTSETLRLLYATPRAWLEDGKQIILERAPTAFGEISLRVESQLKEGKVTATLHLPDRMPQRMLLRLRLPNGYKIKSARSDAHPFKVSDGETIDITGPRPERGRGRLIVNVQVEK